MYTNSQVSNFIFKNILPVYPPVFSIKRISLVPIFISIISVFSLTNLYAQHSELVLSSGERIKLDNPNGGASAVLTQNGKIVSVQKENLQEVVHLIVTFKEQPLSAYQYKRTSFQKASLSSVYASLQAIHSSFRTDLNTIQQQLSVPSQSVYNYTIMRDYYRALNGVALECKRGMIDRIRALPAVKHVSLDKKVKIDLTESVHQIRADIVQDSLGYKGNGILIGEIDTGVDYDNPALGGGFGPGFRVIGGHDFANNDNDPMDDHGHGTHVAGIIGANSGDTLRGVAPEVKFLAVKVLNANGEGWVSDVLAGIDYCLDPDNNPATDDAVDIINMSLAAAPSFDNPLDIAVDNATNAGVLSVVAAGNFGFLRYGTIQSPGTSETALTVGACDSANHVAIFSSLGPDPIHTSIKPEVVAPGVNILSTILHNEIASWSGTSMATPHVVGIAALLKQQHPAWTPEELKAAIINSAHSVGDTVSLFTQGKGCVDALDAAKEGLVVEPGVLSFGWVDLAFDVWKDTMKLKVKNFRNVSQNIHLHVLGGVPSGATLTFDQTTVSLAPLEEETITAFLTVPASVPILRTEPFAYFGKIEIASDSDDIIIPFSFIKSKTLIITFDIAPTYLSTTDRVSGKITNVMMQEGATKYTLPVPDNPLDIMAYIHQDSLGKLNYYFVDHKINNPVGLTYVYLSHNEASINMAGDTIYDIHNNKIDVDSTTIYNVGLEFSVTKQYEFTTGLGYFWYFQPIYGTQVFFSPLDSAFFIHKEIISLRDTEAVALRKITYGLKTQQDIAFSSGSDNLFGYNVTSAYDDPYFAKPSNWIKGIGVFFETMSVITGGAGTITYQFSIPFVHGTIYFNKQEIKNDIHQYHLTYLGACYNRMPPYIDTVFDIPPILRTPGFTINEKGEAVFEQEKITTIQNGWQPDELSTAYIFETLKPGETISIENHAHVNLPDYMTYLHGESLFLTGNLTSNDHGSDRIINNNGGIKQLSGVFESKYYYCSTWNMPLFTVQAFAHNRSQINMKPYKPWSYYGPYISDDNKFAFYEFDNLKNNAGLFRIISDAHPYTLLGQSGRCTADFEYQIPNAAVWPSEITFFPSFNLLQVSVDGRAADVVRPDQNGKIRLVLFDPDRCVTSVKLLLLLASGEELVLPASSCGGNEYIASIPTYIPTGFIDITAKIKDTKGNTCELTASPAFYFGSTTDSVRLDARIRMASYSLNNVDTINFRSGDTLKYSLSYVNYGNNAARNVLVTFPTTPYFIPIGTDSCSIDSLGINDTIHVPINLVFQGKQQSIDEHIYYSPSITWTSGGTTYLRKYNVLVDFQNTITSVAQTENFIPNKFELFQNYPNPFNPTTTIRFSLKTKSFVSLKVYDILGREVTTLINEEMSAGYHSQIWNAATIASGIYFYRLQAGSFIETKKLVLLR